MANLARERDVRTAVGLQARSDPSVRYARDLIAQGYVGDVLTANLSVMSQAVLERGPGRMWQAVRANGANPLTISGGHAIDALCSILGEVVEVSARVTTRITEWRDEETGAGVPVDAPDCIAVAARIEGGAEIAIQVASVPAHSSGTRLEIYGDEGALFLTARSANIGPNQLHGARGSDGTGGTCTAGRVSVGFRGNAVRPAPKRRARLCTDGGRPRSRRAVHSRLRPGGAAASPSGSDRAFLRDRHPGDHRQVTYVRRARRSVNRRALSRKAQRRGSSRVGTSPVDWRSSRQSDSIDTCAKRGAEWWQVHGRSRLRLDRPCRRRIGDVLSAARYQPAAGWRERSSDRGRTRRARRRPLLRRQRRHRPTILYFHGNGEIAADHDALAPLYRGIGVNLFVAEFRGYGKSSGRPSMAALVGDGSAIAEASTAISTTMGSMPGASSGAEPRQPPGARPSAARGGRTVCRSDSSRAAPQISAACSTRAGLAESALDRTLTAAHDAQIRAIRLPTLVIHGEQDELVPLDRAKELQTQLTSAGVELLVVPAPVTMTCSGTAKSSTSRPSERS